MYQYQFPPFEGIYGVEIDEMPSIDSQMDKLYEELEEADEAPDKLMLAVELLDVIHAAETALRIIARKIDAENGINAGADYVGMHAWAYVINKNDERGYYYPGMAKSFKEHKARWERACEGVV